MGIIPIVVIRRLASAVPAGAGSVVMATGVVSLCFLATGPLWLSRSLFTLAAVVWGVLIAVLAARSLTAPGRMASEAGLPFDRGRFCRMALVVMS